jgi:hypothetical protein
MMTVLSEDKYGVRQEVWEHLIGHAEETLMENSSVLLGAYPTSSCLFNLDYGQIELLCVYGRNTHDLLNPIITDSVCPEEYVGNSLIRYKSIDYIAAKLSTLSNPFSDMLLGEITLYITEPLKEEEIFLPIKYSYADLLKNHYSLWWSGKHSQNNLTTLNYLKLRTELLFFQIKNFVTNHEGYDISAILQNEEMSVKDKELVYSIYNNDKISRNMLQECYHFLKSLIKVPSYSSKSYQQDLAKLGKEIYSFYIMQL